MLPALARRSKAIPSWKVFEKTPYLQCDDLPWLVRHQQEVLHRPKESALEADLILRIADLSVPSTLDLVLGAARHNGVLAVRMEALCAAVMLDSEDARRARREHEKMQEGLYRRARRRSERQEPEPSPQTAEWLDAIERRPCMFWRLLEEMARKRGEPYTNSMNLDVESFSGWLAANETTGARTIEAAERFLRECDPDADSWFGTQQFALSAMGAVRALMLLKSRAPQKFASFDSDTWKKWIPALLGIPNNDRNVPLLAIAYRHSPEEVIRRIQQLVRVAEAYVVHKLSDVLDDNLTAAIIEVAREGGVPEETLTRILEPLLQNVIAREYAESVVRGSPTPGSRETAIAVAAILLLRTPNESWETIWPVMTAQRDFGRAVIARAVDQDHFEAAPVYVLEESRVADLYLWLTHEYPPQEEKEGVRTPDTRDNISSWRSRCLDSLKRRGTRAACDALRRLATELPGQTYLAPLVVEGELVRRQKSWQPTPIAALRKLVADQLRRLVRSETELADVILESLRRLEANLQGETPAAFDLWNTTPTYRPKSENECSNYIARHLREDLKDRGVILAREVEIRPTASPGSGERTDIHVDVVVDAQGRTQTFSVILEAKGCWNRGIPADLADQLAHRYLRDNATHTGVFLVGWFQCPVWDASDYRKQDCGSDRTAVTTALAAEAAALRTEGFDIRPIIINCSLR